MSKSNQNIREILKNIPSIDHLILYCNKLKVNLPQVYLKNIIINQVNLIKKEIIDGLIEKDIKKNILQRLEKEVLLNNKNSLNAVINGTGIILHTGLGRAPISKKILLDVVSRIYPYSNLEYDISNNSRGERNNHVDYLINSITGSEASIVVNNNAAAVMLALNTFSNRKEVIISRGELVEIGGSFRIPDVIKKANCKMIEVGTTNKTHLNDYKKVISKKTGMIMIAHTSNYKVVGFTESVDIKKIVQLAKDNNIPTFFDLGSGTIVDYSKYGLSKEKLVKEYIDMGVDIISFSGDKLIGGPQTGILCGKNKFIRKIHSNSMYRALRCDKLTISLLESILRTYINDSEVDKNNLTFNLLTRSINDLDLMGLSILKQIDEKIINLYNIKLVDSFVEAGSGSLPIQNINSKALQIKHPNISVNKLSQLLRNSEIPIIGYIKDNFLYIDLKAILDDQIESLIKVLKTCLK